MAWPRLRRDLKHLASSVGREHRHRRARDSRSDAVGATRQDDRHTSAEDEAGAVRIRQETELFGQHIPGLEIRNEEDVRIAGNVRLDALDARGLFADRVVEREGAVQETGLDLASLGHLAERGGIYRRRHL